MGKRKGMASGKRDAVLDAAKTLFLAHGFAETSVDAVVAAAGVSKPTAYRYFPTKEALLEAVVKREADRAVAPLPFRASGDVRADLEMVATALLTLALGPESLAWDRMMAAEARRRAELGRLFHDCGPALVVRALRDFFRDLAATGAIEIPDAKLAADFFFGATLGAPLLAGQLTGEVLAPRRVRARAAEVADLFLRAFAPRESGGRGARSTRR